MVNAFNSHAIAAVARLPASTERGAGGCLHPISRTIEPLFQIRAGRLDIAVEDNNLAFTMRTIRQAVWRKAFEFQAGLYLYGLVIPRDELLSKPVQ